MTTRPTFAYYEGFASDPHAVFEQLVRGVTWDERMRARKTASFGRPYDYSGMVYPESAFPPVLERLRHRIAERLGWCPNNCLLNLYADGRAKMGMHADATDSLEEGSAIAIVSLGATRSLVFQRHGEDERLEYPLHSGSLLVMPLSLQQTWRHGVPKCTEAGPRISATFRRLRET